MSRLQPCPACNRHVRADEGDCPFCGAVVVASAQRTTPVGRFTRAAIFAGALAGSAALAGCGPTQTHADPPPPPPPTEVADAGAEPPPPPPVDAATPKEPIEPIRREPDHEPRPYGAPPARQRLV